MAKTIKSSLRLSMVIRNLGSMTNYTMTKRFINTSVCYGTNYNRESLVSPQPHLMSNSAQEWNKAPMVQDALRNSRTTAQIFDVIRANKDKMSPKETIIALQALVDADKSAREQHTFKMYEKDEFLTLCELLKKQIRSIDGSDCVTALKTMVYFNVPTTSVIVQMILQMLRHSINDLPLQQISFLTFLLSKCEKTPLVEALNIALPLVYENNVTMKLDRENINSIKNALTFLSKTTKNSAVISVILNALKRCKQPIDPSTAQSILWALCELQCYTNDLPDVLHQIQSILAQNITALDQRTMLILVELISRKIKQRELYYYHEGFVDACASTAITENWSFIDAVRLLDLLLIMGHTQISLLDFIAGKCFEDPMLLEMSPPHCITQLVNGFAAADYKPIFWETVQKAVMTERILSGVAIQCPPSRLAISLLSLDCYWPELLKSVFERQLQPVQRTMEKRRVLLLYQAVATLYPQYPGVIPVDQLSDVIETTKPRDFPLLTALESALGGSPYVLTNIKTKLGHVIDHAIIMRKGGFPVAINDDPSDSTEKLPIQLEDIKPPEDGRVILILHIPARAYSINTQRMKGSWVLQLKTLEIHSGYTVIPIRSTMWMNLTEADQISYLMQAIKLKCEEHSISASS